jgi:hypothetical protein
MESLAAIAVRTAKEEIEMSDDFFTENHSEDACGPDHLGKSEKVSGLREAVFGFSDDGEVRFYYPEDVEPSDDDDFEVEGRWASDPALPGEPAPLLALKHGGSGLWIGRPREWEEAVPNGWVAFTEQGAALLRERAGVGDLLIPLSYQG